MHAATMGQNDTNESIMMRPASSSLAIKAAVVTGGQQKQNLRLSAEGILDIIT